MVSKSLHRGSSHKVNLRACNVGSDRTSQTIRRANVHEDEQWPVREFLILYALLRGCLYTLHDTPKVVQFSL